MPEIVYVEFKRHVLHIWAVETLSLQAGSPVLGQTKLVISKNILIVQPND
jgi:hypothetical protein